ncbi:MAG: type II toxin-antitoxin system HipA family toxin [Rhodocyclaceae bacterium]|nr:type II toxin-antitoxin system HipA family toxin [Rhodocyclaceae bacterium]
MHQQLDVWLLQQRVGTLTRVEGLLSFSYAPEWLARKATGGIYGASKVPLSQSLPERIETFDDRASRPYFAGLLPEGNKRHVIARVLHVSEKNDFGLLDGIGGECAGAVTFLEQGQQPASADAPNEVRWLDNTELLRQLEELPKRPMLAGEDGIRLSLAGAQDKLPVVVDLVAPSIRFGLPLKGTPSSHIIKPPISGVEGSVFNEGFCMRLAAELKLDVAKTFIHRTGEMLFLVVQRYDRRQINTGNNENIKLGRLHQEDFCQALGVVPEAKYQNEGGPDLEQIFSLVKRTTRPSAPNTLRLIDFVIFNALIGNHDAHAKNFSLLYTEKGAVLAPLYDALSTAVYPNLNEKMAMKIGSKYKFADLQARHWEQFATAASLSPAQVRKRVLNIAGRLPNLAKSLQAKMEMEGFGHKVLGDVVQLIEQRCAVTERRFSSAHPTQSEGQTAD